MLDFPLNGGSRSSTTTQHPNASSTPPKYACRPSSTVATVNSSTRERQSSISNQPRSSSVADDNLGIQQLPQVVEKLEQSVLHSQSVMDQLRCLTELPCSELQNNFILDKIDGKRAKIRSAGQAEARNLAESYLMSWRELERRHEAQRRRMDVLEGRTARMETLFNEQIQLNKEIGDEALNALKRFVDDEQRLCQALADARAAAETQRVEADKMKNKADSLEENNRQICAQMDALTQEKATLYKQLVDCQTENHSFRLKNEQMLHELQTQSKLLESKDEILEQLREQERRSNLALTEKESLLQETTKWKEEAETKLIQERHSNQKQLEQLRCQMEKEMQEERAKLEERIRALEHNEYQRLQLLNNEQQITESLQKAAESHRKLERERNQFFAEKKELEENLDRYKRRFVAELNRELSSQCQQLGTGLNTALMEVLVRLNCEQAAAAVDGNEQQRQNTNRPIVPESATKNNQNTKQPQQQQMEGRGGVEPEFDQISAIGPPPQRQRLLNSPPPPCNFNSSASSIHVFDMEPNTASKNPSKPMNPAPPSTTNAKGSRAANKENLPSTAAKKRPMVNIVGSGPMDVHTIRKKPVPINVLAAAEPWRPPGHNQQKIASTNKKHPRNQVAQQRTPTSVRPLKIGAPLYTSTPDKRKKFPAFHL